MDAAATAISPCLPTRHEPARTRAADTARREVAAAGARGPSSRRLTRSGPRTSAFGLLRWLTQGEAPLPLVIASGALFVAAPLALIDALFTSLDLLEQARLAAVLVLAENVLFVGGGWIWLRAIARAAAHGAHEASATWPSRLACVAAAVAQLALAWHVVTDAQYQVRWLIGPALGRSILPTVTVHDGGTRLRLEGAFTLGAKQLLRRSLDRHPGVRLVELDSPGGLVVEGLAIGRLIEARGLDTFAPRRCHSACVMAFAGGTGRFITAATVMAMHSAGGPGATEEGVAEANRFADTFLRERGVDRHLVDKGSAVPYESAWIPEAWVLLASGLATDYRSPDVPSTGRHRLHARHADDAAPTARPTVERNG